MPVAEKAVTALIGPSGCGKSTLLRAMNRMYALYPGQRATGEIMLDGEDILRPGVNLVDAARPHRHGVPEADAVPDVDLRQRRLRRAPLREPRPRPTWTTASRSSLRRAALWDEVKDKLRRLGPRPLRRPAAAPVRRPRHRREARDPAARRAHLGPRPDLQRQAGGDRHPAEGRLHHRHRHPQPRPGRAGQRLHRLHVPGRAGRVRRDRRRCSPSPATKRASDYITGRFG